MVVPLQITIENNSLKTFFFYGINVVTTDKRLVLCFQNIVKINVAIKRTSRTTNIVGHFPYICSYRSFMTVFSKALKKITKNVHV